ncbi:MAG TPA: 8-amino-7-oxononanoate synthase [Terriglobia bacterium]
MKAELAALRAADQFRELATPAGVQLNSNDYLGLSGHPRLEQAVVRGLEEDDRFAATGSRLLSGNHPRWEELEAEFAAFVGAEAALYFPSGYAANVGLLSSVLKPEDIVFSDASNHASLIDGIRLSKAQKVIFPHLDLNFLEEALRKNAGAARKVVVVESIFSMDGDHAPLEDLAAICARSGASLIVDAAHSVGVELRRQSDVLAAVYPCGKALASMGAFVAGSRTLREYLINHARTFIFSTALPPYCSAHVREAIRLVGDADVERSRLEILSRHLRERLRAAGFDIGRSDSQIVPVILGSNETALQFAAAAQTAGFAIRAIRPPTVPAGTARLRVSLNARLRVKELDRFVETILAGVAGVV